MIFFSIIIIGEMIKDNDKNKNRDNIIHAMVITTQKVIDLMGKDLSSHFMNHQVSLLNVSPSAEHGPDSITLVLLGKQGDIKKSLNQLKKVCYEKENGIEKSPVKSLPPILKGYLSDIEDPERFEKLFEYCSKEYIKDCQIKNIQPHPEVVESI
jgi:hypothetical protein